MKAIGIIMKLDFLKILFFYKEEKRTDRITIFQRLSPMKI